ncbi:hypothetical protein BQ8482_910006 [Mesorhizobium delmotii]|uniref:Uncharacterized protein n=1 Tax=Mesorhizobium delmotii TaxID=1631247 RepID=A0A2P9AXX0_9HYPH|nr:hypothetical protein BQ8482_910006 [Mesorhizobium delmotii]
MALKLAIDREEILNKILRGYGTLGNDFPVNAGRPTQDQTYSYTYLSTMPWNDTHFFNESSINFSLRRDALPVRPFRATIPLLQSGRPLIGANSPVFSEIHLHQIFASWQSTSLCTFSSDARIVSFATVDYQ